MRIVPTALALLALTACEPNQLYMASHTVVGINAAVNPEQTTGKLLIGYDRTFAAVVPRSVPTNEGANPQKFEAMTALVCSNLWVDGITVRRFTESLATGDAAKSFADHLNPNPAKTPAVDVAKVKDFFDCFKERKPSSLPGGGANP